MSLCTIPIDVRTSLDDPDSISVTKNLSCFPCSSPKAGDMKGVDAEQMQDSCQILLWHTRRMKGRAKHILVIEIVHKPTGICDLDASASW